MLNIEGTAAVVRVTLEDWHGLAFTDFQCVQTDQGFCGGKDSDHPCTQRDDMEQIYPLYREADVVVFASPLYYWFISGFLKNAFDRLFAIAESDPNYRNPKKESVLIMAAEGAGFEESEHWYDHLEKHIGWKSLGKILCGYVTQPGDTKGKKELQQAYELGKSIQ